MNKWIKFVGLILLSLGQFISGAFFVFSAEDFSTCMYYYGESYWQYCWIHEIVAYFFLLGLPLILIVILFFLTKKGWEEK